MDVAEIRMIQKMTEKGKGNEYGCGGDGGETEDDRKRTNMDVTGMGVKQKTTRMG